MAAAHDFVIMNASSSAVATEEQIFRLSLQLPPTATIVSKTCTLHPREEKEGYGWFRTRKEGTVNRIGLVNRGFEKIAQLDLPQTYIISISGSISEIQKMMEMETTADLFEVNISCPNIEGGSAVILNPLKWMWETITMLAGAVKWSRPYGLKLPPFTTKIEIEFVARAIIDAIGQPPVYVVCCNALPNGIVDGRLGALSGAPLKPISLFNVRFFRRFLPEEIAVYGCGGIESERDIEDYKREGANGVQIGSSMLSTPDQGIGLLRAKL